MHDLKSQADATETLTPRTKLNGKGDSVLTFRLCNWNGRKRAEPLSA